MAQFPFLGTWDDSWAVMASILQVEHLKVIPDLKYDRPEPGLITVLDNPAKELLMGWRFVFLWSAKFSRFPPVMERTEDGADAGKYTVDLVAGGPGLALGLPPCYERGGILNLAPGSLYYAKHWFNSETELWEKPTPELRAGFREVIARIRLHVTARHEFDVKMPIGHQALSLLREKKAKIA